MLETSVSYLRNNKGDQNTNLNLRPKKVGQRMKIIYSNYFVEVHQVLHYVRSSHRRCSVRKGFLRNFAKFTGKRLCQSFFCRTVVAGVRYSTFLKKRPWYRCFSGNFFKIFNKTFSSVLRDLSFQTCSIIDFISPRMLKSLA